MASLVDVQRRVASVPAELRAALACSALLLAYGNSLSTLSNGARESFLLWSNLGLMALLLVWALRAARFSPDELGLDPGNAGGSAMFGIILSVLAAVPPVLFITLAPLFNGGPVEAPDIEQRSGAGLAYFLLFRQPVGTALFEEVAFRGVLYGTWLRVGGDRTAVLATAGVFALWHAVITSRTVAESGVVSSPPMVALGVIVSLAGLFVGGLIFAYLRWHTRSIAAATVAHWLIVAGMVVAVWSMG
ncbi:MAG: CPBP family intramembrane glutamic endopeptidase [Dehalococcoidia bacterium]|nr:CPBP family intramembrane glutamic endopeptidase [Dehalococcoidia bacterium]